MATVTHIIRSEYDPDDRGRLERETGQLDQDGTDPWQTESSFSAQRRYRAAPTFIPATMQYNEWGPPSQRCCKNSQSGTGTVSTETASWYKSLVRTKVVPAVGVHRAQVVPLRPSSAPTSEETPKPSRSPICKEGVDKNNWFISRALRSEPSSAPSSPAPTLADILARDPPPLPSEERYKPPVWLHIGPGNKGFSMLQRSGWNEGEGLGAHVARTYDRPTNAAEAAKRGGGRPSSTSTIPDGLLTTEDNGPGAVAQRHGVEIIDLTLSDAESEQDFETLQASQSHVKVSARPPGETSASQQKSLLTPIPTVLKADRLGIGLKAKTEGPYKQSKKRVTHNAAALSAHIKASEETRRKKAEVGRGRRGFAKLHKREEERRKSMLAYFNE